MSGKTCTGKTTFASVLEQYGYTKIELDKIVMTALVLPYQILPSEAFVSAYRGEGLIEHTKTFIKAVKEKLESSPSRYLVVEGAIAKADILQSVFAGLEEFMFVYFHPVNVTTYIDRIKSRYINGAHNNTIGLPNDFWSLVNERDVLEFSTTGFMNKGLEDSIKSFAKKSMAESNLRLAHFKVRFPTMSIVEF